MKSCKRILTAVPFLLLALSALPLHADPADSDRRKKPTGFYDGIILLSGHGGSSLQASGNLITHDREVSQSEQKDVTEGRRPILALSSGPLSTAFLVDPDYSRGNQSFADLEYGVTSHIGLGISSGSGSVTVRRQEMLPQIKSLAAPSGPVPYMEAVPMQRKYYSENGLFALVSFHPLSETLMDPYVIVRAGGVVTETAYRGSDDYFSLFLQPNTRGSGWMANAGLGLNIFMTREFGFKVEASGIHRYLHADAYSKKTLDTAMVTAGFIFNWDAMSGGIR